MDRRSFVAASAAAILPWPALAQRGASREHLFQVRRNGEPIGWHRVRVIDEAATTRVEVDIELDVKILFVTVYRYRHTNREVWDDAGLVSLASRTDDNGTPLRAHARREGGLLVVDGAQGRIELPADTLTTTYWHPRFMTVDRWIDTQRGQLARSSVREVGIEPVLAGTGTVQARRFRLEGDLTADIWYEDGHWVSLAFAGADGSAITYAMQPPGTTVAMLTR